MSTAHPPSRVFSPVVHLVCALAVCLLLAAPGLRAADDVGDTPATALAIAPGTSWHLLETGVDIDVFRVSLQSGKWYSVGYSPKNWQDAKLTLYGTDGATVLRQRTNALTYTPSADGDYFLAVQVAYPEYGGEIYALNVAEYSDDDHPNLLSLVGPGDQLSDPASLGSAIPGTVEVRGDSDFFAFQGVAGRHYRFDGPGVQVYDESGNALTAGSFNAGVTVLAPAGGSGLLYVEAWSASAQSYELTITTPSLTDFVVDSLTATKGDVTGGAITLTPDDSLELSATLRNAGSVDWSDASVSLFCFLSSDEALSEDDLMVCELGYYPWSHDVLAAGGSIDLTGTVYPQTSWPTGTYYLLAQANPAVHPDGYDWYLPAPESNMANNTFSAGNDCTVTLDYPDYPDLQVTALDVQLSTRSLTVDDQSELTVSWTVANAGTAAVAVESIWPDAVYLSPDPAGAVFDPWSDVIQAVFHDGPLDAGGEYSASATVPLPHVLGGPYYLVVETDAPYVYDQRSEHWGSGYVAEGVNETNNKRIFGPIDITQTGQPDLAIRNLALATPQTALSMGDAVTVTYDLVNQGQAAVLPDMQSLFNIVTDPSGLGTSRLGSDFGYHNPCKSYYSTEEENGWGTVNGAWLEAGTYTLVWEVSCSEFDYQLPQAWIDNVTLPGATEPFALSTLPADWHTDGDLPWTVDTAENSIYGQLIPATYALRSPTLAAGQRSRAWTVVTLAEAAYLKFDRRTTAAGWGSGLKFKVITGNGFLGNGESITVSEDITIPTYPDSLVGSGRYLMLTLDNVDTVPEQYPSGELNNWGFIGPFEIRVTSPDLQITDVRVPEGAEAGSSVLISYDITNLATASKAAQSGVYSRYYYSDDGGETFVDSYSSFYADVSGLQPGETRSFIANTWIPVGVTSRHIRMTVDTNNQAGELGDARNNNTTTFGPFAFAAPATAADLAPLVDADHPFVFPDTVLPGGSLVASWYVANQEPGNTGASYWYDTIYLSTDTTFDPDTDIPVAQAYRSWQTLIVGDNAHQTATAYSGDTVPVPGDYYVFLRVDGTSQVTERNDEVYGTDNNTYLWLDENGDPKTTRVVAVDLVPVSLEMPSMLSGSSTDVSLTLRNQGDADLPAENGFYQKLVLSANTTYGDGDDIVWQSNWQWYSGGVAAEADTVDDVVISASVAAPAVAAGIYYVFAEVNWEGQITECRPDGSAADANNVLMRPTPIEIVQPDLIVTGVSWPAGTVFSRGCSASVSVTVRNANAGSVTSGWQDQLYAVDQAGTSTFLGSHWHPIVAESPFAAGGETTYTFDVTLPGSLPLDSYRFRLDTDTGGSIVESSETNNSLTSPASFELAACDLVISDAVIPGTVQGGTWLTLTYTVQNRGIGATPASWSDQFFLSTSTDSFDSSSAAGTVWQPAYDGGGAIPSGESRTVQTQIWIADTQPVDASGQFYVHIVADAGTAIGEYHPDGAAETNNHYVSQPVSLGACDLVVTTPAAPAATDSVGSIEAPVHSGAELEVSWTVSNQGTFRASGVWQDDLYLSLNSNTSIDSGDIRLYYDNELKSVDGGASYTTTATVALPVWKSDWNGVSDFYLKVRTDAWNRMNEYNETDGGETNNIGVYRLHMAEAPAVDLEVTGVFPPAAPVPDGGVARIAFDITNNGTLEAEKSRQDRVVIRRASDDAVVRSLSINPTSARDTLWTRGEWSNRTVPLAAGVHTLTWVFRRTSGYDMPPDSAYLDNVVLPGIGTIDFETATSLGDLGFVSSTDDADGADQWRVENDGSNAFAIAGPAVSGDLMLLTYTGTFAAGDLVYDARIDGHSLTLLVDDVIPAGATRRYLVDWQLPDGTSGDYYATVQTDVYNQEAEPGREDNNAMTSGTFSVALQPYPDLQVDQARIASGTLQTGRVVELEWTVSNRLSIESGRAAVGTWVDHVYLSADNVLDLNADQRVGSVSHREDAPGLAVDGSYTESLSLRLPDGDATTWYVFVVTDAQNRLFEYDLDSNNTLTAPLELVTPRGPYPDLLPFHIGVPSSIGVGSDFVAYWKVENAGDGVPARTWTDCLYLSTNTDSDTTGDTVIGRETRTDGVNMPFSTDTSTSFYTEDHTVPIDWELSPGTYYLKVRVDEYGAVFEHNDAGTGESNNVLVSAPFTVTETPTPNLVVTKVSMEALETRGIQLQVDVEWTVKNIGSGSTGGQAWHDKLYLSTTPNLYGQKTEVASVPNQSYLGIQESYTQRTEITIPWEFAEGDYYLVVMADARGASLNHDVVEYQGEDDNVNFSTNAAGQPFANYVPFLVEPHAYASVLSTYAGDDTYPNVSQEAPVDDEGDIVVHTPIVTTGQRISASWTVRNTGNASMTGSHWDDGWALSTDPYYDASDFWLGSHNYHSVALAPGESDRLTGRVSEKQIPISLPSGDYYLLIVADTHRFGSDYSGNIGVAPTKVSVQQAPPADLLVVPSSIQCTTPQENWRTGAELRFRWRVENRGWWPTLESQIYDRVYLVPVDEPDRSIAISQHYHSGGLDIVSPTSEDWFYEAEATWTVPADFVALDPGARSFQIKVETGISNFEGAQELYPNAKGNNSGIASDPITITATQPGDLRPTALTLVTPASQLRPNATVELQWSVKNNGPGSMDASVQGWRDAFYLADADNPAQRSYLGYRYVASPSGVPMQPGDSYTLRHSLRLPANVPERMVFIVAADSSNLLFERYETNNQFTGEAILPPAVSSPELAVSAPVLDSSAGYRSGDTLGLTYTVTNSGGDVPYAQRSWTDRVMLSADTILGNEDDTVFAEHSRYNGLPGTAADGGSAADAPDTATYSVTKHVVLPDDMEGTWYLFCVVDAGGAVEETDETNNTTVSTPVSFTVQLAEAPDLVVSSIDLTRTEPGIAPDESGNPATVLAGQAISGLSFEVANQSPTTSTGDKTWVDAVFLSRDQVLDRNDKRIASHTFRGELAAGASYGDIARTPDLEFTVPAGLSGEFYLIVATDYNSRVGNGAVYERAGESNNVLVCRDPFFVELPTNSAQSGDDYFDLQVTQVTPSQNRSDIPIQPGQSLRVRWTVANAGTRDIENAGWEDAVYLSADATWDSNDTFVGSLRQNRALAAGQIYDADQVFALPAIDEGAYRVIVRTDVRQSIPEPVFVDPTLGALDLEANNEGVSAADTKIDTSIPQLFIEDDVNDLDADGITHKDQVTRSLQTEEAFYYRVDTQVGFDLRVALSCEDRAASTELFVKFGGVPSAADADFVFTNHFQPDQEIIVPGTQAGSYYIMVRGDEVPNGPANVTLTANYMRFEILDVSPAQVGNAGSATFTLNGAMFDAGMTVQLRGTDGRDIPATEQFFVSPNRLHATFKLAGVAVGNYAMVLVPADDSEQGEAVLADAVQVVQGRGGRLTTRLIAPNAVRPGNQHLVWIEYANQGDADVPAPLLHLSTRNREGVNIRLYHDDPWRQDVIELLGINRSGPADRLPPGCTFSIPVTFSVPAVGRHTFILKILDTVDTPLDWQHLEMVLANEDATDTEQNAMLAYLKGHFGITYRSFAAGLRQDALRRWRQEQTAYDVRELLEFAATRGYENDVSTVSGFLRDDETGAALAYTPVVLVSDDGDIFSESTDANGAFCFNDLPPGTFSLFIEGYLPTEPLQATLTYDQDAIGLQVAAYSAETPALPTPDPQQPLDNQPSLTRTADGTLHMVWTRNRQLWHAVRDSDGTWTGMSDDNGNLLPGAPIPGASGIDPHVLQDGAGTRTRGGSGEIVVVWRTGATPEAGLNASHAMYVIGRPVADSSPLAYEWTEPAALTQGEFGDTQVRAVLDGDRRILTLFLQQDWTLADDDPDLYWKGLTLDLDPTFVTRQLLDESDRTRSAQTRAEKSVHSLAFSKEFGGASVPSFIPLIGGEYKSGVEGALTLELQQCQVAGKGALSGSVEIPHLTLSAGAEMSASWKALKKECRWAFNDAQLRFKAGGEAKVPIPWTVPLVKPELGGVLKLEAGGNVKWQATNLGGVAQDTDFDLRADGGIYGEVVFLKDWLEAEAQGTAFVVADYRRKEGVGIKEYGFRVAASVKSWFTKYTFEKEWSHQAQRSRALGITRDLVDEDTLRISRTDWRSNTLSVESITIERSGGVGTGNDYSEDGAVPVEGLAAVVDDPSDPSDSWNGVIDANPAIARNADGSEILAVWVQESGNPLAAQGSGTKLMLAEYAAGSDSWSVLPPLEEAGYFNRAPVLIFDSKNDPWVFWTRSKANVSFSSPVSKIYEATTTTDICFTHRVDGVWTQPAVIAELTGSDEQPAAAAGPDGRVAVVWVNRDGDFGSETVYAARYDANLDSWAAPKAISTLAVRGDDTPVGRVERPALAYDADGVLTAVWPHLVTLEGGFETQTLITRAYVPDSGWQTWEFMLKPATDSGRGEPDRGGLVRASLAPPWDVPEACCEKKKEEEKPKPKPKPEPPDPRDDDDDDDDWGGDDEHDFDGTESHDPNEKRGPKGYGDRHAVAAGSTMSYTIMFENKATAGPASVVRVTDQLEAGFDLRRFRLGEFAWGDTVVDVAENRPFHLQTIRLASGMDLTLLGTVDPRTRTATWEFRTIDPQTGQIPANPLLGFLPPNDDNHAGEGHVTFFITPAEDIAGGTEVKNTATIIFDTNEAIVTNETSHLVTRANLDTGVGIEMAEQTRARRDGVQTFDGDFLTVTWGVRDGSDALDLDAPGAGFDVYHAVGDGPYTLWKSGTKATSATLAVTRGLTYRFYSVARDGAGNIEPAPYQPDLTVRILHGAITLGGHISYQGKAVGILTAVLEKVGKSSGIQAVYTQQVPATGIYAFPAEGQDDLPGEDALYNLTAFLDVNGNGLHDAGEPGATADNPIDPVGREPAIVVNLTLADVDSDADSLPDWWEQEHFATLDANYYGDEDGDGVPTGIELAKGTNPNDAGDAPAKGVSTGPVVVFGGQLYRGEAPFAIKGVLYRPAPPGKTAETMDDATRTAAIQRHIPLVSQLGANTLRISHRLVDDSLLDACAEQGLAVMVGFPIDTTLDLVDPEVRAGIAADFAMYVAMYAGHDAVLMWCVGDGVNARLADETSRTAWFQLLNLLGWIAYDVEGQSYHPVTTVNTGLSDMRDLSGLDLWGLGLAGASTFGTALADYEALGLAQPLWLGSYGISAWNDADAGVDELTQAETDVALAQDLMAASGTPAVYAAADGLLYMGDAAEVTDGQVGTGGNLAFHDADADGRPGAAEAVWADAVDSREAFYEPGFDADVPLDPVVAAAAAGTGGLQTGLSFHDANGNGQWDAEEDIWLDTNAAGALDRVYDQRMVGAAAVADTLLYSGRSVEVVNGTPGIRAGLYFADLDANGVRGSDEPLWADRHVGIAGVFDQGVDTLLHGEAPADGTSGTGRGLFLADTGTVNGVWDEQEDVWFDEPGQAVGGTLAELLDLWSAAGMPTVHDADAAEHFGLLAYEVGSAGVIRQRLSYQALQNLWGGGDPETPVVADTHVVTSEDQPVTFPVLVTAGANHQFRILNAGANGSLSGWNEAGPLDAVTYTPRADFAGADRITYEIVDTRSRSSRTATILIQVVPVDDPPRVSTFPDQAVVAAQEDAPLELRVIVSEPDGDPVSITAQDLSTLPGAVLGEPVYDLAEGVWQSILTWTPGYDVASLAQHETDWPVTFTASDDAARSAVALDRVIRVANVNRAPTAPDQVTMGPAQDAVFANQDLQLAAWTYTDPDGDPEDANAVQVRWFKKTGDRADEMLPAYSNALAVPAAATAPGDVLFCRVWPSDGADPAPAAADQMPGGESGQSADIQVLNDLAEPTVSPSAPRTADTLSVQPRWLSDSVPAENVRIQWVERTAGDAEVGTEADLPSDVTSRGRTFVARLTAYRETAAGTLDSVPVETAALTILDTPPPAPGSVGYDADRPQAGDAVQIVTGPVPADADGDPVTLEYQWSLDQSFNDGIVSGALLPADTTEVRDLWCARVRSTAPDGARGTAVSAWVDLDPLAVGLLTQNLTLNFGWNLLSFGISPVDQPDTPDADESTASGLFGSLMTGSAWYWQNNSTLDQSYIKVDATGSSATLKELRGFWLYHGPEVTRADSTALAVDGWKLRPEDPYREHRVQLQPGWNMIGVPEDTSTMPSWLQHRRICLPLWSYNADAYEAEAGGNGLKRGVGYWLYLLGDTPLEVDLGQ